MVCIAAFIILCIVGVFVAFISIFRRDIGRRYLKVFKQSLACVGKKARLQKCETGFKDNVKNGLLARVILKNPKLLKPASIIIETLSVCVVLITVWSLVESAKAGLALWTLGTCNVEHPASCALSSSEVCAIDGNTPQNPIEYIGQWFSDWGQIFGAIPDKFRSWEATNFDLIGIDIRESSAQLFSDITDENTEIDPAQLAIDIVDPGCIVCARKFKEQLNNGFFEKYAVKIVPFVIKDGDGTTKFANSELIVRFIFAADHAGYPDVAYSILKRVFTEKNAQGRDYQTYFNYDIGHDEAQQELQSWLTDFATIYNMPSEDIEQILAAVTSDEITQTINHNHEIVMYDIHAKGIPTLIYDNKKH